MATQLHAAAERGQVEVIERLIQQGINVCAADDGLNTPIHLAAYKGHPKVIELLLKAGADIDVGNENLDTPLHLAALANRSQVVYLLTHPPEGIKPANIAAQDAQGYCAIHYSCGEGFFEVVRLLVEECNADLHCKNIDGLTPLMCAVQQGHVEIAEFLLQKDPSVVVDTNCSRDTALHYAAISPKGIELAKLLLIAGADPEAKNADGHTPLIEAMVEKQTENVVFFRNVLPAIRERQQYLTGPSLTKAIKDIVENSNMAAAIIDSEAPPSSTLSSSSPPTTATTTSAATATTTIHPRKNAIPVFSSSNAGARVKTTVQVLRENLAASGGEIAESKPKTASSRRIFQPNNNSMFGPM